MIVQAIVISHLIRAAFHDLLRKTSSELSPPAFGRYQLQNPKIMETFKRFIQIFLLGSDAVKESGGESIPLLEDKPRRDSKATRTPITTKRAKREFPEPRDEAEPLLDSRASSTKRLKSITPNKSPRGSTSKPRSSGFSWNQGSKPILVKDKNKETWYQVQVIDKATVGDSRLDALPEKVKKSKRGAQMPVVKQTSIESIAEGDWIRIHYPGFSAKYDEWVLFSKNAFACIDSPNCKCSRHN